MHRAANIKYARGTWGYTIFRTVYTEESDQLFPIAMEKLNKWLTQYHFHANRFPPWGDKGKEKQKQNGSVNDEVARRFRMELIEDNGLHIPNLEDASPEDIKLLCDRFCSWVTGVGGDPECRDCYTNPRMLVFLVIDSKSLRELANMDDEIPPLRTAVDLEERRRWRSKDSGWLWAFDYQAIRDYNPARLPSSERGWMKMDLGFLAGAWFFKANGLDRGRILSCKETTEISGEVRFWFDGSHC